jgi:predicted transcriptional regulator
MKLTQKHLDIIKKASHRASISIANLSEDLPYKEHVVRRALEELLRHEYLHRSIFVDFYRLGFTSDR